MTNHRTLSSHNQLSAVGACPDASSSRAHALAPSISYRRTSYFIYCDAYKLFRHYRIIVRILKHVFEIVVSRDVFRRARSWIHIFSTLFWRTYRSRARVYSTDRLHLLLFVYKNKQFARERGQCSLFKSGNWRLNPEFHPNVVTSLSFAQKWFRRVAC